VARTIHVVTPPSRRKETRKVLAVAVVVLTGALGEIALSRSDGPSADLPPGATVFADLSFDEQRAYRELLEGLTEAERLRSDKGRWPTSKELAEQAIPPFARLADGAPSRDWFSLEDGSGLNYLGWPRDPAADRALLLLVIEPGEWAAPGTVELDEEHHQLAEGDLIHVSVWVKSVRGDPPKAVVAEPAIRGWTRIWMKLPDVEKETP
jgi:hypothetical protein